MRAIGKVESKQEIKFFIQLAYGKCSSVCDVSAHTNQMEKDFHGGQTVLLKIISFKIIPHILKPKRIGQVYFTSDI